MEMTKHYPLANDANGNPLDVPADAVAWRVRRGGGRRGRPRIVFDNETGRQLEVPLESTIDDLVDHGCPAGRYRLEAVNAAGHVLPGIVAVTEIPVEALDASDEPTVTSGDPLARLLQTVERQTDTLCRALEAMAQSFGPLRPAQMPIVIGESGSGDGGKSHQEIVQSVTSVANSLIDAWKLKQATGGGA
jgi:hypothetical protein